MWQQWRYFYVTFTALLITMTWVSQNDAVASTVHSFAERIADMLHK